MTERLRFRHQFAIGPSYIDQFLGCQKFEITASLHLTAHPDLNVCQIASGGKSLTLLGYLIDPNRPQQNDAEIVASILNHADTLMDCIEATSELGGRWIMYKSEHSDKGH